MAYSDKQNLSVSRDSDKPAPDGGLPRISVFLSSPGDVADERDLARRVLRRLAKERSFAGRLQIEEVSWDDPDKPVAMDAHLAPQENINRRRGKPSECDLVAVILWSRLGTPTRLMDDPDKPDGTLYNSGTQWEFQDAITAAERTSKPTVWLYHRTEDVKISMNDPRREEAIQQWEAVRTFFDDFKSSDGTYSKSYHLYDTPSQFERLFEQHFREWLTIRLEGLIAESVARVGREPTSQTE